MLLHNFHGSCFHFKEWNTLAIPIPPNQKPHYGRVPIPAFVAHSTKEIAFLIREAEILHATSWRITFYPTFSVC